MMKIPFDPTISADQQFQVLIPERAVIMLTLRWNTRSSFWYVDIESGGATINGLKIVPRWPLLEEHRALSPLEGDLMVLPLSGNAPDPIPYEGLGTSWGLFWLAPEDVEKWRVAHGLG